MLRLEDLHEMLHHTLVKVLSTQMGITVCCNHLEDTVVNGEQGDIESATAEVVHQDVLLSLLVQTVCDSRCCWLVDNSQDVETSDHPRILRGLTLLIVEICGHRDNCMLHLLSEVVLGGFLHLCEYHGGHLLRSHNLVLSLHLHANERLATLVCDLEWQQLDV